MLPGLGAGHYSWLLRVIDMDMDMEVGRGGWTELICTFV
jgi:hypothetical protein